MLTNTSWLLQRAEKGWHERKEAGLLLRWGSGSWRRCRLCEEVEIKRAGRGGDVWQWEVKERTQAAKLDPQRLWNLQCLYTNPKSMKGLSVKRKIERCSACSQQGVNALWWPLSWTAPLSRNGRIHCIQLHKPHWNLTPVSMETDVSHAQKHAKC